MTDLEQDIQEMMAGKLGSIHFASDKTNPHGAFAMFSNGHCYYMGQRIKDAQEAFDYMWDTFQGLAVCKRCKKSMVADSLE